MKQLFILLLLFSLLFSGCATTSSERPVGFIDPEGDATEAVSVFPSEGSGAVRSSGIVKRRNWGLGWGEGSGSFWLDGPGLSAHETEEAYFFLLWLPYLLIHLK